MAIISFLNMKGGVAKTTLAVNVADNLVKREDKKVLLIDIDPQFNATQCLIDAEDYRDQLDAGKPSIVDIFDDSTNPVGGSVKGYEERKPKKFDNIEPWELDAGIHMIPGNLQLYRLDMGMAQGREYLLKRYIEKRELDKKYDHIIIDTPPTPSPWMTSALVASDYYIVPVKPEPLSATGIDLLRGIINQITDNLGLDLKCIGLVLTIVETRTRVYKNTKSFLEGHSYWKDKLFKSHLLKRTEIARMQDKQKLILESDDTKLLTSLTQITKELIRRIEENE